MRTKAIMQNKKLTAFLLAVVMIITTLMPMDLFGLSQNAFAWSPDTTYTGTEINAILKKLAQETEHPVSSSVLDKRYQVMMPELDDLYEEDTVLDVAEATEYIEEAYTEAEEYIPEPIQEIVTEIVTEPIAETQPVIETQPATQAVDYDAVNYVQGLINSLPTIYTNDNYFNAEASLSQIESAYAALGATEASMVDLSNYYASQNAYNSFLQQLSTEQTGSSDNTDSVQQQETSTESTEVETTTEEETTVEYTVYDINTVDNYIQSIVWSKTQPSESQKTVSLSQSGKLVAWYRSAAEQRESDEANDSHYFMVYDNDGNEYKVYKEYKNTVYLYYAAEDKDDHIYFNYDMSHAFQNMQSLTDISGLKYIRADYTQDMSYMFCDDKSLTDVSPLKAFNTYSLTNVSYMFSGCRNLSNVRDIVAEQIFDLKADEEQTSYDNYLRLVHQYTIAEVDVPYNKDATYDTMSEEDQKWYPAPYTSWQLSSVYADYIFYDTKVEEYPDWYYIYNGWEVPSYEYNVNIDIIGNGIIYTADSDGTQIDRYSYMPGEAVYLRVFPDDGAIVDYLDIFDTNGFVTYDVLSSTLVSFIMPESNVAIQGSFSFSEPETEEVTEPVEEETSPVTIEIEAETVEEQIEAETSDVEAEEETTIEETNETVEEEPTEEITVDIEEETETEDIEESESDVLDPHKIYAVDYVDENYLNSLDFSSKRIMVKTYDKNIFVDESVIISNFNFVYLLQFDTEETTRLAYAYYMNYAEAVEVDTGFFIATEDSDVTEELQNELSEVNDIDTELVVEEMQNAQEQVENVSESIADDVNIDTEGNVTADNTVAIDVEETDSADAYVENELLQDDTEMTSEDNPLTILTAALEDDDITDNDVIGYDIALIDTGANGADDAISMLGGDVYDYNGHGTAMLEAIKEQNPSASVLSIKALSGDGTGDMSTVYAAIQYAIAQRVSIINLSISARASADNIMIEDAINEAVRAGIIVVGAAGNQSDDASNYVPGRVESAYIIGACKEDGEKIETSNYGLTVDYYVIAETTSEAAAIFSGYISANGMDEILMYYDIKNDYTPGTAIQIEDDIFIISGDGGGGAGGGGGITVGGVDYMGNAYTWYDDKDHTQGDYSWSDLQSGYVSYGTAMLFINRISNQIGLSFADYYRDGWVTPVSGTHNSSDIIRYYMAQACKNAIIRSGNYNQKARVIGLAVRYGGWNDGTWIVPKGTPYSYFSNLFYNGPASIYELSADLGWSTTVDKSKYNDALSGETWRNYVYRMGTLDTAGQTGVVFVVAVTTDMPVKDYSFTVNKVVDGGKGKLTITKSADDKTPATKDFEFTLVVKDTNSKTVSTKFSYTGSKSGTISGNSGKIKLRKGQSITVSGIPAGYTWTVTETEDSDYAVSKKVNNGSFSDGRVATGTIPSPSASQKFTFTATFSDKKTYSGIKNGGTFTLKAGESKTIGPLPANVTYTITETAVDKYSTKVKKDSGKYATGLTASANSNAGHEFTFQNAYSPDSSSCEFYNTRKIGDIELKKTVSNQLGSITVSKAASGDGYDYDKNRQFKFTLQVTNADGTQNTQNFSYSGSKSGTVNGNNGTFTLLGGQSIVINGLPLGSSYKIIEAEEPYYNTYVTSNGGVRTTGYIAMGNISPAPPADQEFEFVITFSDKGSYNYTGSKTGTIKSGETIKLKHNESVTIKDIPYNVTYTVKENIPVVATGGQYEASIDPTSGTISSAKATVSAKNTFNPGTYTAVYENIVKPAYLTIEKASANTTITDNDDHYTLAGAQFAIYETYNDALYQTNPKRVVTTDASGRTETFKVIPWKTYYYREVAAPRGYKINNTISNIVVLPGNSDKPIVKNEPYPKTKVQVTKTDSASGKRLTTAEFTLYEFSLKAGQQYVETTKLTPNVNSNGEAEDGVYSYYGKDDATGKMSRYIYGDEDNPQGLFVVDETTLPGKAGEYIVLEWAESPATWDLVGWTSGECKIADGPEHNFKIVYEAGNIHSTIEARLYKTCPTTPGVKLSDCEFVIYEYDAHTGQYKYGDPIPMTWQEDETSIYGGYYKAEIGYSFDNLGLFKWKETLAQQGYEIANPADSSFTLTLSEFSKEYYIIKNPLNEEETSYPGTITLIKNKNSSADGETAPINGDGEFKVYAWNEAAQDYTTYVQTLRYEDGKYYSPFNLQAYPNTASTLYNGGRFKVIETKSPSGLLIGDGWSYEFRITNRNKNVIQDLSGANFTVTDKVNKYQIEKYIVGSDIQLKDVTFLFTKGTQTERITTGENTDELQHSSLGFSYSVNNGIIYLEEIEPGSYMYKEVDTPPEYKTDSTSYTFVVNKEGKIVIDGTQYDSYTQKIYNTPAITLHLTKTEPDETFMATGRSRNDVHFPAGTKFSVYEWSKSANGGAGAWKSVVYATMIYDGYKFVDERTGQYMELEYSVDNDGRFLIEETEATEGYIKDNRKQEIHYVLGQNNVITYEVFEIDGTNRTRIANGTYNSYVNLTFENVPNKFEIYKVDERGNVLGGATFRVDRIGQWNVSYEVQTDNDGIARIYRLAPGSYKITEVQAPTGYLKDSKIYKFTITNDGKVEVVDENNVVATGDGFTLTITVEDAKTSKLRITKQDSSNGSYYENYTGFPKGTEFSLYEWDGSAYVYKTRIIYDPNT